MAAGDWPLDVETAFLAAVDAAVPDTFKRLHNHEPKILSSNEMPAVTMLAMAAPDEDVQTGPASEVTWTWSVRIYASLAQGYEDGQLRLRTAWPKVLLAIRRNPGLGLPDDLYARLRDPGGEPEFDTNEQFVMKRLTLEVQRLETS